MELVRSEFEQCSEEFFIFIHIFSTILFRLLEHSF